MSKRTFQGGIRPYEGKRYSKDKSIKEILPKGNAVYPLSQHIGAPSVPIVKVGDSVVVGQVIAEAGGYVSVPLHASVSGKVLAIEPRRVVSGSPVNSIVIENDGEFTETVYDIPKPYEQLSKEEIVALISKAGIVGLGGAGFPTHVKLSPKEPDKIDYIIANCCECEPYLTSDYRRMVEEPEKMLEGLKILLHMFPKAHGVLAIEDNKPDCIATFRKLIKDEHRISLRVLKTKYPQGAERMLIYSVTQRQINAKTLPSEVGCIVHNVDTLFAIRRAVVEGKPLIHKVITVTGKAIRDQRNFLVRIGTSYEELVRKAGGFDRQPAKVISGGPMMGSALFELDIPTTKNSSALLCLSTDDVSGTESGPCINCGRCVDVCPVRLMPFRLHDLSLHNKSDEFLELNGMECFECGCCSYKCPAKRHLAQAIRTMKRNILVANSNGGAKK